MPFVDVFLNTWDGPVSELIIRQSQGVAKRSAASLDWIQITLQLWLVSRLPGNIWMFILKSAHMLHQRPKLHVLLLLLPRASRA